MVTVEVGSIDVFVVVPEDPWRVLVVQRGRETRCPGAWETVHGRIEPGETPEAAAIREVGEEVGLVIDRLYNVCVQPFYLHQQTTVHLAVVFCAFVSGDAPVELGDEHQGHAWLSLDDALARLAWPRERSALRDAHALLHAGHAGAVEDVLRVR